MTSQFSETVILEKQAAQHNYSFEYFFSSIDYRRYFKKFLEAEKFGKGYAFVEDVEEFNGIVADKERFLLAAKMIDLYFASASSPTVQVVGKEKVEKLKYTYRQCSPADCPVDLFDDLFTQILLELKLDYFDRFIKSELFQVAVEKESKRDPDFLSKLTKRKSSVHVLAGNEGIKKFRLKVQSDSSSDDEGPETDEGADIVRRVWEINEEAIDKIATESLMSPEESEILALFGDQLLHTLVADLKKHEVDGGIKLKTIQKNLFKSYADSFTGAELINWICVKHSLPTDIGAKVATVLLQRKVIRRQNKRKIGLVGVSNDSKEYYSFSSKKKVVIIGGGFAGATCANMLKTDFDVTIIDRKPTFEYIMDFPWLAIDNGLYKKMCVPFTNISKINFIQHAVKDISPTEVIVYDDGRNSSQEMEESEEAQHIRASLKPLVVSQTQKTRTIPFDYLVVATGSRCAVPFPVDEESLAICIFPYSAQSILANYSTFPKAKNIAVIGAGPTGIEIAAEIADKYKDSQVYLLNKRSVFLESQCKGGHEAVATHLTKFKNMKVLSSRQVVEIKYKMLAYQLVGGTPGQQANIEYLPVDLVVVACGALPRTEMFQKKMPYALDKYKRVVVNDKFQVVKAFAKENEAAVSQAMKGEARKSRNIDIYHQRRKSLVAESLDVPISKTSTNVYYDNIFAIGDIASMPEEKLAQVAMLHAKVAAANIKLKEKKKKLITYSPESRIQIISTGCGRAVMVKGDKVLSKGVISGTIKQLLRTKVMGAVKN